MRTAGVNRRIAVLADTHANLPALQAACRALSAAGRDEVYHLGDAIGIGPFPAETLALFSSMANVHMVMGNHDRWFADGLPHPRPEWMSEGEVAHHRWVHAQAIPAYEPGVAQWPWEVHTRVNGLRVQLTHYALNRTHCGLQPIVKSPTSKDLDELFDTADDVVFYGHDHAASDLVGRARYVNPGSLGCFTEALARFVIIDVRLDGTYRIHAQRIPYDDSGLFRELASRDIPERAFISTAFFARLSTDDKWRP